MAKRKVVNLMSGKTGVWFDFFYSELNADTLEITYGEPMKDGPRAKIRNPMAFLQDRAGSREQESEMWHDKKARNVKKVVSEKVLTAMERKAENEDMIDYMIEEVEGFKLDGVIVKNTKKGKVDAMKTGLFAMFINRCIELLQKQSAVEEVEEAKNSSTGSSLQTTKPDPG